MTMLMNDPISHVFRDNFGIVLLSCLSTVDRGTDPFFILLDDSQFRKFTGMPRSGNMGIPGIEIA